MNSVWKRLDEKLDHAEFGSSMWKWSMGKFQGCRRKSYKVVHENMLLCTQTWNHQLDLTWKWFCKTCCFISGLDSCCQSSKCNFWSITGTLLHWSRVLQSLHAIISVHKYHCWLGVYRPYLHTYRKSSSRFPEKPSVQSRLFHV